MTRPTDPTGFRFAWERFRWNVRYFAALPAARADLGHSWADIHVEGVRELGVPAPKIVGKGIVAVEIGVVVALVAWLILVAL